MGWGWALRAGEIKNLGFCFCRKRSLLVAIAGEAIEKTCFGEHIFVCMHKIRGRNAKQTLFYLI